MSIRHWTEAKRIKNREYQRRRYAEQRAKIGKTVRPKSTPKTKEEIREYNRLKARKWNQTHPGYAAAYLRRYRAQRSEAFKEYARRYYLKHRGRMIQKAKEYASKNHTAIIARHRERRHTDPIYKLRQALSIKLWKFMKGLSKHGSTQILTGCSFDELKTHLESKFKPGMTWENWGFGEGKWNIDHIKPVIAFDLSTEDGQRSAFHFSNLSPLWTSENCSKGSLWNGERIYSRKVKQP